MTLKSQIASIALVAGAAFTGCDQDTFDANKESWNYLVCTFPNRTQPEHVAFAVRDGGKAVAAYLRKVISATVTPFEIVFDYYHDGHSVKWRISRTNGAAHMSTVSNLYLGTCSKAEVAKF